MKKNERNAGRKKVLDGTVVRVTVPRSRVNELKEFAKTLQEYEPKRK
jgi:hypothetical protein